MRDPRFSTFEDPFTCMPIPKDAFHETYGKACTELFDGHEITVDLLFVQNPVIEGEWRFSDDDARDDFYDTAVDLGLILTKDEVN